MTDDICRYLKAIEDIMQQLASLKEQITSYEEQITLHKEQIALLEKRCQTLRKDIRESIDDLKLRYMENSIKIEDCFEKLCKKHGLDPADFTTAPIAQ